MDTLSRFNLDYVSSLYNKQDKFSRVKVKLVPIVELNFNFQSMCVNLMHLIFDSAIAGDKNFCFSVEPYIDGSGANGRYSLIDLVASILEDEITPHHTAKVLLAEVVCEKLIGFLESRGFKTAHSKFTYDVEIFGW